jgi:NADPH2:quinone reductase
VTRFKVGDEAFFCNGGFGDEPGNYSEYTTLHEEYCAAKPANLSLQDAAALPLVLITAWEALFERAHLQAGQTILIHAAAGGVGHVAVQLAHHFGARIAVTVGDDKKAGLAHGLGAEKIINYRTQDFVREVMDWTNGQARSPLLNPLPQAGEEATESLREFRNNGQGADAVFDTVGGDTFLRSFAAVRVGGKVASLLSTPISLADSQLARLRNLSLCYELMLTPQVMKQHEERIRQRKILEQGAALVEQGYLGVLVTHRLPLEQGAEAHRLIEAGGMIGKIVLTMD